MHHNLCSSQHAVILSDLSNTDVCMFYKLAENSLHGQVFFSEH
jgi:hypothetical protein